MTTFVARSFHPTRLIYIMCLVSGCMAPSTGPSEPLTTFKENFRQSQFDPAAKWELRADTVRLWFDDLTSEPMVMCRFDTLASPWSEWDREMRSRSWFDSVRYDPQADAFVGTFWEDNDFYRAIGKQPDRTFRTYWTNEDGRIDRILMVWDSTVNTTSAEHLIPVSAWAKGEDSLLLARLYPDGRIQPSAANAIAWKGLLAKYNSR